MVGADGWGRDWERPISTKETPTLTVQFVAPRRQKKDRAQNRNGQDWVLAGRSNGSTHTVPIRCSAPSKEGLSAKSGLARWGYSEGWLTEWESWAVRYRLSFKGNERGIRIDQTAFQCDWLNAFLKMVWKSKESFYIWPAEQPRIMTYNAHSRVVLE